MLKRKSVKKEQADRKTEIQKDRDTERQRYRMTGREKDRRREICWFVLSFQSVEKLWKDEELMNKVLILKSGLSDKIKVIK
jgi:hypothetical protein